MAENFCAAAENDGEQSALRAGGNRHNGVRYPRIFSDVVAPNVTEKL
jgi:hypothetical protein